MAKKIQYRAVSIEKVAPGALASSLNGARKLVVAVDVAKTKMMAGFAREDGAVVRLVKWTSPTETRAFVELIAQTARLLDTPVDALMEPTGTYGEPLRALLLANSIQVFMLSPKRVHDAAEVFDGVPSMHDAKACIVMARLHQQDVSKLYVQPTQERLQLRALVEQRELYAKPMQFYLGRLEALLARHWPEALQEVDVDYTSAAALEKACGLNLKTRSSGNYDGRLSITKRGSGPVRRYLFLASLRLVQADPLAARWFQARAGYRGGHKLVAVVAVMRKLIRALWHVARGNKFDSSKLFDERAMTALAPTTSSGSSTSHDGPALHELGAVL